MRKSVIIVEDDQELREQLTGILEAESDIRCLGAFASAATAFSAYGNQVLRVGGLGTGTELYGVLLELKIASGLRTLAQMLSL